MIKWLKNIFKKKEEEVDLVDQLIDACEEVTYLWEQCYQQRKGVKPWIDWQEKEVIVIEHFTPPIKVEKENE